MKRLRYSFYMLFVILCFIMPAYVQANTVESMYKATTQTMLKEIPNPTYGDEWSILTLARGEATVPSSYFQTYYTNLVKEVQQKKGKLHAYKYTEYARVVIALAAIGKDATNVGGYNLVAPLEDVQQVNWQGVNGTIFALIALDTWQYETPARMQLIQHLLDEQLDDGGFSLSSEADIDLTAMAVQALTPYANEPNVKEAFTRAITKMNALQAKGFQSAESIAQVITARAALNEPVTAELNELARYYTNDGFKHLLTDTKRNGMASEQASYALVASWRAQMNRSSLYDMRDTKGTFIDSQNSWATPYIQEAVSLGLLKGYSDGTFKPSNKLTRAQAVSIITRALQLTATTNAPYTDTTKLAAATQKEIAAAYEAGIIKLNGGRFDPHGEITRIQLGLMLVRAYSVRHTPFMEETATSYKDTVHFGTEEQQALNFLAHYNIATGSDGLFRPYDATTRAQMAKMSVQFVKGMNPQ